MEQNKTFNWLFKHNVYSHCNFGLLVYNYILAGYPSQKWQNFHVPWFHITDRSVHMFSYHILT